MGNNPLQDIRDDIREFKDLFLGFANNSQNNNEDDKSAQWKDLNWLCSYLPEKRAKATLYPKLANGEIPGYKQGKSWYFLKSEIDDWLKKGKIKTILELEAEANNFLASQKKQT